MKRSPFPRVVRGGWLHGACGAVLLMLLGAMVSAQAAEPSDQLSIGFVRPPRTSYPETWFHLIGGNVSKQGITADLEAIRYAGLQGIQLFHGRAGGPWPGVQPQIECLSPSWDDMIRHVADECRRLELRFTMQNCPGWAMSGGPWITPEKAMRRLVWSRCDVPGGASPENALERPQPSSEDWRDYRDVAVVAFPTPVGDLDGGVLKPKEVRSDGDISAWKKVLAGAKNAKVRLEPSSEAPWIEVHFATPTVLRSLELPPVEKFTLRRNFDPGMTLRVQAVTPGGLVDVARRTIPRSSWQDNEPLTLALPDYPSRGFRLTFELKHPVEITSLGLSSAARTNDWQGQAAFVLRSRESQGDADAPTQMPTAWVAPENIVDLSDRFDPKSGRLNWSAPAGSSWTVVRFGHVNTGARNAPAPKEATGFECNKLSAIGAEQHFAGYIGRVSTAGGPAGDGRLHGMLIDSWECRTQTWTSEMEREFATRRGYALRAWLPALAGWVVGKPAETGRFLRDWRATINDLLVDNYFGRMAALGRERGLLLSFETAIGDVSPGDILQYFGKADIPMCEFWQPNDPHWGGLETKPIIPCVSAAHIYGKPLIAAEAFTCIGLRWNEHPYMLKHIADRHFTYGLNRLVFHTYTHNPRTDLVPGTSFGSNIGAPFLRGQTWWRHMPAFTTYLARCQWMLTQGRPVVDVLWFLGDELDHKPRQDVSFPNGYTFDYLNADVLQKRLSVRGGALAVPEGQTWKILWLRDCRRMTVTTLARIRELVQEGATVIGAAPREPASLMGGADAEGRFSELVRQLWGERPGESGDRRIGSGRLLWGGDLGALLARIGVDPDVAGTTSATWCHRRAEGTDIYFLAANRTTPLSANLCFRAAGRPELWDPLTGARRTITTYYREGAYTVVPVALPAAGSAFVVFRDGATKAISQGAMAPVTRFEFGSEVVWDVRDSRRCDTGDAACVQGLRKDEDVQPWVESAMPPGEWTADGKHFIAWREGRFRWTRGDKGAVEQTVIGPRRVALEGPWMLTFPAGWDTPATLKLQTVAPWSALEPEGVKHFSGTATYVCEFMLPRASAGQRAMLDLGRVGVIAEVCVNGSPKATLWAAPYRIDVSEHVRSGINRIEVTVTNTWFNRLAFDAGKPESERRTWTHAAPAAGSKLEVSGLVGPVVLHLGQEIDAP